LIAPGRKGSIPRRTSTSLQGEDGFDWPIFPAELTRNIAFEVRAQSSPSVTAVTARDAFGVDLTFVQTYSQAQGDV